MQTSGRKNRRRSIRVMLAAILCMASALLAFAGSASAKEVELHLYDNSFNGSDAIGAGPFSSQLQDLSFDQANNRLYAGSLGSPAAVYKFNGSGVSEPFVATEPPESSSVIPGPLNTFGDIFVDNSGTATQGRFYAFQESGAIRGYGPNGNVLENFPIAFTQACGGDAAPDGTIWIGSWGEGVVKQFEPDGSPTGNSFTTPKPCDVAIDSQGYFYTVEESGGRVRKYTPGGTLIKIIDEASPEPELAIDLSDDHLFVVHRTYILEYDSDGTLLKKFGEAEGSYPGLVNSRGIAVRASDHKVYAMNEQGSNPRIDTFVSTGTITVADVTTEDASDVTRGSAKLNGTLNPDGVTTTVCKFEWGPGPSGPYSNPPVPCDQGNVFAGESDVAVTASLPSLTGGTTYHFRLKVDNTEGPSPGENKQFTTVSAVKDTKALPPTNITRTSATLNGSFDADGFETSYWFEWGQGCCGSLTKVPASPVNAGAPVGTFPVSQTISGLEKNSYYRYRLVATNSLGETKSEFQEFFTVGNVKDVKTLPATEIDYQSALLHGELDPDGFATKYWFEYAVGFGNFEFQVPAPPGADAGSASGLKEVTVPLTNLSPGTQYTVRLVAQNELGVTYAPQQLSFTTKQAVKNVTTLPASDVHLESATLNGSLDPDGIPTTYYFQWGSSVNYQFYAPVDPPGASAGETPGQTPLSASISGLKPGVEYHYRLVAENFHGKSVGADQMFFANDKPVISNDTVSQVNTDGAILEAEVNPSALETAYKFEYGPEPCSISSCTESITKTLFPIVTAKRVFFQLAGLDTNQTVYFRVVASNARGTTIGDDRHFTTYAADPGDDDCGNTQVRRQTGSALLLDCRAYELVSAANAGGYDVESDLIPEQEPLVAFPDAGDRVLYSVHEGMIPGAAGSPTNYGRDPYVAARDGDGWTTSYVGLPADGMAQDGAFGSPLLGADSQLRTFAFGGEGICDPCFGDGSTNVPLRLATGELIAGMTGNGDPAGDPVGYVSKPLSEDGSHFVFGSTSVYATGGNAAGSIYERDLAAGVTELVSTDETGTAIAGGDVGALDVSSNGSRVVVAKQVDDDIEGNRYWRPYMHVAGSANSVPLAPGTTSGVLFAGMTDNGQDVFFTTVDQLLSGDTDGSADLYRSHVGAAGGPAALTLISGESNSDACDPAENAAGDNWNGVGSDSIEDCSVVGIAGGGGVANGSGTIYFLSPEALDGDGVAGEPNLFVAGPGGSLEHVATLESDNPLVLDAIADNELYRYGDFQATRSGAYAVFNSSRDLTGFVSTGHSQIYRYALGDDSLSCASCAPSGAAPTTDSRLPGFGLAVTDDGRVFFSSAEAFVLRDTNEAKDAYEFSDRGSQPVTQLISTGGSSEDSGILSVTPDGEDAYFFTRQVLVHADENGSAVKIYDARENGGFLFDPPRHPCAASDECHGAGTVPPGPPNINTQTGSGSPPPVVKPAPKACKKGFVKRKGKCVKKTHKKKHKKGNATKKRQG